MAPASLTLTPSCRIGIRAGIPISARGREPSRWSLPHRIIREASTRYSRTDLCDSSRVRFPPRFGMRSRLLTDVRQSTWRDCDAISRAEIGPATPSGGCPALSFESVISLMRRWSLIASRTTVIALLTLTAWRSVRPEAVAEAEAAYAKSDVVTSLRRACDRLDCWAPSSRASRLAALCLSRLDFAAEAERHYGRAGHCLWMNCM